jgi:hypothetical protein
MDDMELRTIVAFSLRYALPRHTYAFDMVSSFILRNIQHYEDWEIKTMIEDCKSYYPSADFGGDTCDRPAVDRFKQKLVDELENRRRIMLESIGKYEAKQE